MKTIAPHTCRAWIPILYILLSIWVSQVFMISAAAQAPGPTGNPPLGPPTPGDELKAQDGTEPDTTVQMTDIHDLKPPMPLGPNPLVWLYILISAGTLALLITFFLIWNKRRKHPPEEQLIIVPPEEIARGALKDLAHMNLDNSRIFYFRLSTILRSYIEARYHINALEMTSEEFLPQIEQLGTDRKLQQNLKELIRSTDPIKFAGQIAPGDKMQDDMAFARDYVDQTTPVQETPEDV